MTAMSLDDQSIKLIVQRLEMLERIKKYLRMFGRSGEIRDDFLTLLRIYEDDPFDA